MTTISHTDNLLQKATASVNLTVVPGVWVRLLNNSTATNYYSTAVTDVNGAFTHSAVPGDYSLYYGLAATVVGTPTLVNAHYAVPLTAGDDAALGSLTAVLTSPYTPTAVPGGESIAAFTAEPTQGVLQLGTGTGGMGNLATSAQILPLVQPTFLTGTTQAGSDTTHAVVIGNHTALVGYYYVATGVAGSPAPNPSVPIISASFAAGNTTFVISTIIGHSSGQSFEVSLFPGGTSGYPRTWDNKPPAVFKPTAARTVFQIGPNTALYQVDTYGTVYLIGFDGSGANGDHFRDLRVADIGVYAIENNGTNANTSPAGTEPATVCGYLGYNGSCIKMFRDSENNPRSKSFQILGTTGETSWFASAATAVATFQDSPKTRFVGTSWTGAASLDSIAYIVNHVIDATGAKELQMGFEAGGAGAGKIRALALLQADLGIQFLTSADPGIAGAWYDGTETFLQATNGNIFLRPVAGANNSALVGTNGGLWTLKDGGGTTRQTLDDGSGNAIVALRQTVGGSVATTAGGSTTGFLRFGSASALGIYFGSGAPSITAPKGSLYLRTDGASNVTRAYINTDAGTTWTAINTVA